VSFRVFSGSKSTAKFIQLQKVQSTPPKFLEDTIKTRRTKKTSSTEYSVSENIGIVYSVVLGFPKSISVVTRFLDDFEGFNSPLHLGQHSKVGSCLSLISASNGLVRPLPS